MKLYRVSVRVRHPGYMEAGMYGVGVCPQDGWFHVLAEDEKEAEAKAVRAANEGAEPDYVSVLMGRDPSRERVTPNYTVEMEAFLP